MMNFSTIVDIAKKTNHVYIAGHTNPDGDCIGSTLALAMLLNKVNVTAKVLLKDVPSTYNYLPIQEWVTEKVPAKVGLLLVLDCGDINRLGDFEECCTHTNTIINIDHHMSNTNFGIYNHVDQNASSTCEVIYNLLDDKELVDETIAKALYTGIIYDTGIFKHSCTTEKTHQIAGKLISYGFDFSEIIDQLFYAKTLIGLKTQSKVIEHITLYEEDKIIVSYLTKMDMDELDTNKKFTEGIVQMLNEVENVACAVFIYETEIDVHKISLRSKGLVDVCEVAKTFGGGGHIKASGCSLNGHLDEVILKVIGTIKEQLREKNGWHN